MPEGKQLLLSSLTIPPGEGDETKTSVNPTQRFWSMHRACRCGARTRQGTACKSPAVRGKSRCRMHGGAAGSGAPKGKANGNYRHGHYTAEALAERTALRKWVRDTRR